MFDDEYRPWVSESWEKDLDLLTMPIAEHRKLTNEIIIIDEESEGKGCWNCEYQIKPFRTCEWMESGGDGRFYLTCPRWEKRRKRNEQ